MARELQNRVLDLIEEATGTTLEREVAPPWLMRPGVAECGPAWTTVRTLYEALTDGAELPEVMPARERRSIDAVLVSAEGVRRIVEVDEVQHFTPPRARTLALYPRETETAFDRTVWAQRSAATTKLRGGGFARPCPPLFPGAGGRHLQRAYRDALADLLPAVHGWAPTLRVGDFEVRSWMHDTDAVSRMKDLLMSKGAV